MHKSSKVGCTSTVRVRGEKSGRTEQKEGADRITVPETALQSNQSHTNSLVKQVNSEMTP